MPKAQNPVFLMPAIHCIAIYYNFYSPRVSVLAPAPVCDMAYGQRLRLDTGAASGKQESWSSIYNSQSTAGYHNTGDWAVYYVL